MQKINLNIITRYVLTVAGLAVLALALMLNHYYPHNEGVAAPPRANLVAAE